MEKLSNTCYIIHGDSIDIVPKLPEKKFSLVYSDPPYGISYDKWDVLHDNKNKSLLVDGKKRKRTGKPIRGWSKEDEKISKQYRQWVFSWVKHLPRLCVPASAILIHNSRRLMHSFILSAERELLLQDILAYIKPGSHFQAFRPFPDDQPNIRIGNLSPRWEPILVFRTKFKGTNKSIIQQYGTGGMNVEEFKNFTGSYRNMIEACSVKVKQHPTQKDVETTECLIRTFSPEKSRVLDPFMGSGTTGIAALKSGRVFVGIEKNKKHYNTAKSRLLEFIHNEQRRLW